jgi:hypothetical protein
MIKDNKIPNIGHSDWQFLTRFGFWGYLAAICFGFSASNFEIGFS